MTTRRRANRVRVCTNADPREDTTMSKATRFWAAVIRVTLAVVVLLCGGTVGTWMLDDAEED